MVRVEVRSAITLLWLGRPEKRDKNVLKAMTLNPNLKDPTKAVAGGDTVVSDSSASTVSLAKPLTVIPMAVQRLSCPRNAPAW
jgi:hypothetical protein